jgi:glutathione S-transferase
VVFETSAIIEYLAAFHPGPMPLIPADAKEAVPARMLDRVFDSHVMGPVQTIVFNARRPEEARDPYGVAQARIALDTIYAWLDYTLTGRRWAAGDAFTLADAAAAPSLFYADWVQPIGEDRTVLKAYRARLLARPSFARCVDDARPYRLFFPLGAPDRD